MILDDWLRARRIPVGLRTIKTALAVTLALVVVQQYGASPAKVVFATIGAMSAVGATFKDSLMACLTQICGVVIGALLSICLLTLHVPDMVSVGVGIILILAAYQAFRLKLVPVLPCLILVNICLNPEVEALPYALGRIWDTAIGLGIGMLINTLIFPYDNSRKIRQTMAGLDRDLIQFLEDQFDGDEHLPQTGVISRKIGALEGQLALFSQQRLLRRKRQKKELAALRTCEDIAHGLLVELETLRNMERQGRLNQENRQALRGLGAKVSEDVNQSAWTVEDVVVNYHVARVLRLRRELKDQLAGRGGKSGGKKGSAGQS